MLTGIIATICVLIGVAVVATLLKSGAHRLSPRNLPRDVLDALRRTQPDSRVRRMEPRPGGGFNLRLIKNSEPRNMTLLHHGRWTIGSSCDPAADLPSSGSFEFLIQEFNLTRDERLDRSSMDERIQGAVQARLLDMGFTLAAGEAPDFKVGYYAVIGGESLSGEDGYERGSWIIDLLTPSSERVIWRGSANADIVVEVSAEEKQQRVNEAVKLILDQYPPQTDTH